MLPEISLGENHGLLPLELASDDRLDSASGVVFPFAATDMARLCAPHGLIGRYLRNNRLSLEEDSIQTGANPT